MAEKYVELDMENAQPKWLLYKYQHNPQLLRYIRDREAILEEVISGTGCSREHAKQLFIRLMFGGKISSWKTDYDISEDPPGFCFQLQCELQTIKEHFVAHPENVKFVKVAQNLESKEGKKWENSAVALWLQDLEAQCMMIAIDYLVWHARVHPSSLIHDGILIYKSDVDKLNTDAIGKHVNVQSGLIFSFSVSDMPIIIADLDCKSAVIGRVPRNTKKSSNGSQSLVGH